MDEHTLRERGVPGLVLMETAGRAVAELALLRFGAECADGIDIVCGRGNNGGDGYVAARLLHGAGWPVRVAALPGPLSPDAQLMAQAARGVGVEVVERVGLGGSGLVIDAVLGTGLSQEVRGPARAAIEAIGASGRRVLAVDIPSGLCGDTGRVMGAAVRAEATACLGRLKVGLYLEPGADLAGEVLDVDIGLLDPGLPPAAWLNDRAWVEARLPRRGQASHKGTYGHLAVVAGSVDRAGAAVLVCEGALRSGCGLVTLFVDPEALPRLGALPPEVMVRRVAEPGPADLLGFGAAAVGPGFGLEPHRTAALRRLWAELPLPAVFDADGLTALGEHPAPSPYPRCITPHPKEAGRLLGLGAEAVQADRLGVVQALGQLAPALLKGRHTLISGSPPGLNPTGSPALAVGGTGDVLTGLVGGLLAQGLTPEDALAVGAFTHGRAGELLGQGYSRAAELARMLPAAFNGLAGGGLAGGGLAQGGPGGRGSPRVGWPLLSRTRR